MVAMAMLAPTGEGADLQKRAINKIRAVQDHHTEKAEGYFRFLDEESLGFIDGLRPYVQYVRKTYDRAATVNAYFFAAKSRVKMLLPFLPVEVRVQLKELLSEIKGDTTEKAVDPEELPSAEDIGRLLAELRDKRPLPGAETIALMVETLAQTGIRISELLAIKPKDLKENGAVRLLIHGKGRKERSVYLEPELLEKIRAHFRGKVYLIEHGATDEKGKPIRAPYTRQYATQAIRLAGKLILGRSDLHAHTLRHFYATQALANGVSLPDLSRYLGHSSVAVTGDIYAHGKMSEEQARQVWESWKPKKRS